MPALQYHTPSPLNHPTVANAGNSDRAFDTWCSQLQGPPMTFSEQGLAYQMNQSIQHYSGDEQKSFPPMPSSDQHKTRACASPPFAYHVPFETDSHFTAQMPNQAYTSNYHSEPGSADVSPCSTPPLSISGQNTHFEASSHPALDDQGHWSTELQDAESDTCFRNQVASRIKGDASGQRKEKGRSSPFGTKMPLSNPLSGPRKICGACSRCRRLKMKCEFKENAPACSRCTIGRHECIQEERKPRNPGERERLQAKLRQREAQVQSAIEAIRADAPDQTPLTFVPSRLQLDSQQRDELRTVLLNATSTRKPTTGQLQDIRSFLEAEEWTYSGSESSSESSVTSDDGMETSESKRRKRRSTIKARDNNTLPHHLAPIGFIAHASLEEETERSFFQPGPLVSQNLRSIMVERGENAPKILLHGLVSIDDVQALFDIFFARVYPFVGLLDPDIHTPAAVLVRSPFLFTVICAIASRYARFHHSMQGKPDVYQLAMHYAKTEAASALIDGHKAVEMCQAYLLMCLYAPKGKRFEEDRSWFYSGVAMRLATDLNLHNLPGSPSGSDERTVREWRNNIRTWLVCFNLDRSLSSQYGKPFTLHEDQHAQDQNWYRLPFATTFDIHALAHTSLLRIMSRYHQKIVNGSNITSLNANSIFATVESFEQEMNNLSIDVDERYAQESDLQDEGCRIRVTLKPFVYNYSRLVILSQALQQCFDKGVEPNPIFLAKALHAATTVLKAFIGPIADSGFLLSSPDCHFVASGFAATFLLKLIDPKTPRIVDVDQRDRIIELVSSLIQVLKSPNVAVDEAHAPNMYAGFLNGLLSRVSSNSTPSPPHSASSIGSSSTSSSDTQGSHHSNYSPYNSQAYYTQEPAINHQYFEMDNNTTWDDIYNSPDTEPQYHDINASWANSDGSWAFHNVSPNVHGFLMDNLTLDSYIMPNQNNQLSF